MTITWTIKNLERQTSDGLVTVVHWGASAVDGDFNASIVNTQADKEQYLSDYPDRAADVVAMGW